MKRFNFLKLALVTFVALLMPFLGGCSEQCNQGELAEFKSNESIDWNTELDGIRLTADSNSQRIDRIEQVLQVREIPKITINAPEFIERSASAAAGIVRSISMNNTTAKSISRQEIESVVENALDERLEGIEDKLAKLEAPAVEQEPEVVASPPSAVSFGAPRYSGTKEVTQYRTERRQRVVEETVQVPVKTMVPVMKRPIFQRVKKQVSKTVMVPKTVMEDVWETVQVGEEEVPYSARAEIVSAPQIPAFTTNYVRAPLVQPIPQQAVSFAAPTFSAPVLRYAQPSQVMLSTPLISRPAPFATGRQAAAAVRTATPRRGLFGGGLFRGKYQGACPNGVCPF